jgi:hypothetical protein
MSNLSLHAFSQVLSDVILQRVYRGVQKNVLSLSAAITPGTLTAVFAQQFGGIDAV